MERALVAAMLDDPDSDDVARRAADSFDRSDPPRGEICRIDIEDRERSRIVWLERLRGQTPCRYPNDDARFEHRRALFEQHGPRWRAELPPGVETYDWGFKRGVWTHVKVTTTWLCEHGEQLFIEHPIVALVLDDRGDLTKALAQPCMRHVRRLEVDSSYASAAQVLAAATTLARLESLQTSIDDGAVATALESPTIRALETFDSYQLRELFDISEEAADGTTKIWRGRRGKELEERYGFMPWVHESRWRTFPGTRGFARRWVAERGGPVDDPPLVYAGTYRRYEFTTSSLSDEAFSILEAAGYRHNSGLRSYGYASDGGPGWASWIYFVEGIEFSDALWIDRVEAVRRPATG
jgi:hypothetical protein